MPTAEQYAWVKTVLDVDVASHPGDLPAKGGDGQDQITVQKDENLAKARQVWLAVRQKIEADIGKLQASIAKAYKGHEDADDLEKAFATRVEPVLGNLDDSLAHKLDAISKAGKTERTKLVGEARAIITSYERFLDGNDIVDHLDRNPLVPISIRKTLDRALDSLGKTLG